MINMLDESILNITRDLERNNLLEHTLIVFTSDVRNQIKITILLYVKQRLFYLRMAEKFQTFTETIR